MRLSSLFQEANAVSTSFHIADTWMKHPKVIASIDHRMHHLPQQIDSRRNKDHPDRLLSIRYNVALASKNICVMVPKLILRLLEALSFYKVTTIDV